MGECCQSKLPGTVQVMGGFCLPYSCFLPSKNWFMIFTGFVRVMETWKVVEFNNFIFQAWTVLKFRCGSWKLSAGKSVCFLWRKGNKIQSWKVNWRVQKKKKTFAPKIFPHTVLKPWLQVENGKIILKN